MKRTLLSLAAALACFNLNAKTVPIAEAQHAAESFMRSQVGNNYALSVAHTAKTLDNSKDAYYVFNLNNGTGFVIISADDIIRPVLAYSTESNFLTDGNSPEALYWLNEYREQISAAITKNAKATVTTQDAWSSLAENSEQGIAKPTGVSPMLTTLWNQAPVYNNACPSGAPTGCVATAMAQIMNFWQQPTTGTGSHTYNTSTLGGTLSADFGNTTYDWPNMPNSLTASSSAAQKAAVGTLMFHCGVSVEMDYTANASGALVIDYGSSTPSSEQALVNYFGYKNTIGGMERDLYSDPQWLSMLKFELDNGRPILYAGFGDAGHAFVFDGYDDNGFFHVNWGWGGISNGYFIVDNLDPSSLGVGGGSGSYNYGQEALIMIEPANSTLPPNPYDADYDTYLALNSAITTSAAVIDFNSPYSLQAEIKNMGPDTFRNGGVGLFFINVTDQSAGAFGYINDAPTLPPDSVFLYEYNTPGDTALKVAEYAILLVYVKDQDDTSNIVLFMVDDGVALNQAMLKVQNVNKINSPELASLFEIYPNPATDVVHINGARFSGQIKAAHLIDVKGQSVQKYTDINKSAFDMNTSGLANGTYFLQVNTTEGILFQKIVIKK